MLIVKYGLNIRRLIQIKCRKILRHVFCPRKLLLPTTGIVGGDQQLLVEDRDRNFHDLGYLYGLIVIENFVDLPLLNTEYAHTIVSFVLLLLVEYLDSPYQTRVDGELNQLLLWHSLVLLVPESLHVVNGIGAEVFSLQHKTSTDALLARLPAHVIARTGARVLKCAVVVVYLVIDYRELLVTILKVKSLVFHHAPEAVSIMITWNRLCLIRQNEDPRDGKHPPNNKLLTQGHF